MSRLRGGRFGRKLASALRTDNFATGMKAAFYEIYHHWRHRYPEGVFENREHVFSAEIPRNTPVRLAEGEHTAYGWFDVAEAAEKVFSPSNRAAIFGFAQTYVADKAAEAV